MKSQRELRYYASIPKSLLYMLIPGGFIGLFGCAVMSPVDKSLRGWYWLGLILFSLAMFALWVRLFSVIFIRKPALQIDSLGFTLTSPLRPKRKVFVSWTDVAVVGIRMQRYGPSLLPVTLHYLAVYERHSFVDVDEDDFVASAQPEQLLRSARLSMPYTYASIYALLNALSIRASQARRAQMLERIKTTFAPEIIQYNIWVDQEERPL